MWISAVAAMAIVGCIPVVLASIRAESRPVRAAEERPARPFPADLRKPDGSNAASALEPPVSRAQPPQQAGTARVDVSERIVDQTSELEQVAAEIKAAEDATRQMDRQRRDLERQARDEQAERERAELKARIETLRRALEENAARVRVGVQGPGDLAGLQEQISTAERRVAGIEADMQRHRIADALEERRLEHEAAREVLMKRYMALLDSGRGTAQQMPHVGDAGAYLLTPGQVQTLDDVAALGLTGVTLRLGEGPR